MSCLSAVVIIECSVTNCILVKWYRGEGNWDMWLIVDRLGKVGEETYQDYLDNTNSQDPKSSICHI